MATKIQLRRDTGDNWDSEDPVLAEGELGVETDTSKVKIGDGASSWSQLPYFADDSGPVEGILPEGGSQNQVLAKSSAQDFDAAWVDAGTAVTTVVAGANVTVDVTDPTAPAVSADVGLGDIPDMSHVVYDDDSALTDARTPTAHAATHTAGGTDPITVDQTQVTGLAGALAGKADTNAIPTSASDVGAVASVVAGQNVTIDATDPQNPIVSASGGGGGSDPQFYKGIAFIDHNVSKTDSVWGNMYNAGFHIMAGAYLLIRFSSGGANDQDNGIYKLNGTDTLEQVMVGVADRTVVFQATYMFDDAIDWNGGNIQPDGIGGLFTIPEGFDFSADMSWDPLQMFMANSWQVAVTEPLTNIEFNDGITGNVSAALSAIDGHLYPTPPESGDYVLKASNGVLSWDTV